MEQEVGLERSILTANVSGAILPKRDVDVFNLMKIVKILLDMNMEVDYNQAEGSVLHLDEYQK